MKSVAILVALWVSPAMADTWMFAGQRYTTKIDQESFEKGVRDGFGMFRYYGRNFTEVAGPRANVRVVVRSSHPWGPSYNWLYRSAWYTPGTINIGKDMAGSADSVRRTVMHELTHYVSHPTNWHRWQTYVSGHRFGDIGGPNATWTSYDVRILDHYGWSRKSSQPDPWRDQHWWVPPKRPTFAWQNPRDRFDVTDDGRVTSRDALVIMNAIGRDITMVDKYTKPTYYYDVDGNGQVSSKDALQVMNEIRRRR